MKDLSQLDLFSTKSELRIIKINDSDITGKSDFLKMFTQLVSKHEIMYPNIINWLKSKVLPGISTGERIAYLGLKNSEPIASAIIKKGKYSKFCHLYIDSKFQNKNLGDLFFAMMALNIRKTAKEAHFTLPESLWLAKKSFFHSFGFQKAEKSAIQYRKFEDELRCSVTFDKFWSNTLQKLPKIINSFTKSNINIFNGLLMSMKPEYVEKMIRGEKLVEIRKKFNPKWRGCRVTIYSSSPTKAILGYATIERVDRGTPDEVWSKYEPYLGCTKKEFQDYTNSSEKIYAIPLKTFETYMAPLYLEQISFLLRKDLAPPQSYISLENNKNWAEAVSIAELLHGQFQLYETTI